ncbi:MAG: hypothetical protein RLZZ244_2706, partial [Verrucomicrobiota bacterium]
MGCLGMPHPAPAAPAAAAPLRPSVSACSTDASGQIRVYGQNPRERVSLMSAASSLKTAMLEALRQPPRPSHEQLP